MDAPAGIGQAFERRARISEVLLTNEALDAVYNRLSILRRELIQATSITNTGENRKIFESGICELPSFAATVRGVFDQQKQEIEQQTQALIARFRQYQNLRLNLPPLPEFPAELLAQTMGASAPAIPLPPDRNRRVQTGASNIGRASLPPVYSRNAVFIYI